MPTKSRVSRRAPRAITAGAKVSDFADPALARHEERRREAEATLARKAARIVEEGHRQAQEAVGRTRYAELRAKIRSERVALRQLGQPPEGLKRDHEKDRQAAKRRVEALLRGLGARARRVEKIQQDTNAKLGKLLAPDSRRTGKGYSLAGHGDVWLKVTGLDTAVMINPVLAPDRGDQYRWFPFRPSYSAFLTRNGPPGIPLSGFSLRELYFANVAGWLGSDVDLEETSDWQKNFAFRYYRSGVVIPFIPPITGRLEVMIVARCLWDTYKVSIVDELGLSSASIVQENNLFVGTSRWGYQHDLVTPMWREVSDTDGDPVSKNEENLIPGDLYCAHLKSEVEPPLPEGEVTQVFVGNENRVRVNTDDMKARCQSIFLWDVQSVWLRIHG